MRIDIDPNSGCWLWHGAKHEKGYGIVILRRERWRVHRLVHELFHGPIPDGMLICHTCDTPDCCSPFHTFVGTHADNSEDMVEKGRARGHVMFGDQNPQSKTSAENRATIRAAYTAGGISQQQLADEYGVTQAAISAIVRGKTR